MLMVHHYMEDHPDYDREPFVPTVSGSIEGVDPPERPASPVKLEPPPIERQKACTGKMPKLVGPASYGCPDPGDPDLFTILQNTLISNRVIQNLTKTNRINHCHTEVHVQPTNPDDELTTIVARALVDLDGPVHVPFDKVQRLNARLFS